MHSILYVTGFGFTVSGDDDWSIAGYVQEVMISFLDDMIWLGYLIE
jgi:hypothetical protein